MILAQNDPFLTLFCQFLENPSMFKVNLPNQGPLFREIWTQNSAIWAAHTRILNMLCYLPGIANSLNMLISIICSKNIERFHKISDFIIYYFALNLYL